MAEPKAPTIYIVSDGRGDTCNQLVRAALVQFHGQPHRLVRKAEVRTPGAVESIVERAADDEPAVVFYTLVSDETREALSEPVSAIVDAVRAVLERAPPELCADIVDKGIVLTGGGSKLRNLDVLLSDETGLPVFLSDEPEFAVVLGTGAALDELDLLREIALE